MRASETIDTITNVDPGFYEVLGPFLGSRDVARAVGGPIWDSDGKTWLVARDQAGTVTGFVGITADRSPAVAESCYTVGGDMDLARRLVEAAVRSVYPTPVAATVHRPMAGAYLSAGFVQAGETVNFVKLIRKGE